MFRTETFIIDAPAIAAIVIKFRNSGSIPRYAVVENLDAASSAAIRFQESDTNQSGSFTDIAGSVRTINPVDGDGQIVSSSKDFLALHAGGGVKLLVTITRQTNGTPTDLD